MQYKCKTISLNKLMVGPLGVTESLCNTCLCKDCTNPIENTEVSVMGVNKKQRVYNRGSDSGIVVYCEGFIGQD